MNEKNEDEKQSKLIQQFYDNGLHQLNETADSHLKQVTVKLDYESVAFLTGVANVFNMAFSHLVAEIIDDSLLPILFSLEKPELKRAIDISDAYLSDLEDKGVIADHHRLSNRFRDIASGKWLSDKYEINEDK